MAGEVPLVCEPPYGYTNMRYAGEHFAVKANSKTRPGNKDPDPDPKEEKTMPITLDSKLAEIVDDPRFVTILDKYVPGASQHPMLSIGKAFSIRVILSMPQAAQAGLTPEKVEAILEEINKQ